MAAPPIADRPVTCREIEAKTVTRLRGTVDPWFLGRYGMTLYRGCEHGCAYCDGRAERYDLEGDFARDIAVKRNALQVLRRELPSQVSSSWKRSPPARWTRSAGYSRPIDLEEDLTISALAIAAGR